MIIVLQVNAPMHMAQGIKESLAMYMEKHGDTKVLEIRPDKAEQIGQYEQMKIGG